ncbi:uncharacterized protein N7479_009812 [Penicillium vulpinum]|uniref:uncharacterized protein n=1 Tax=Penicillium vulpinum TaxID=29845 RepID=UPI00254758E8|nr:uncharacterized protein N7479_009812 [Penicillium vulpinum]KAJ5951399.1 hypothetical protein N7479_009812 [Penicillium vulpinum]
MPKLLQPSVYMDTNGKYFAEPAGDRSDYYWITVNFSEDFDRRGRRDPDIMCLIKHQIVRGCFTVDDRAMHRFGEKCLSFPIKRDIDTPLPRSYTPDHTHPDLLLAENLAGKVILDQKMVFAETRRKNKEVRLEDMLDVRHVLMDPWKI